MQPSEVTVKERPSFRAVFVALAAILAALSFLAAPAFSADACPSGRYPDPDASNCVAGSPYLISLSHTYSDATSGKLDFIVKVTNRAKSPLGISSSNDGYIVPIFTYSDGAKVDIGQWTKAVDRAYTTGASACGYYVMQPGSSLSFKTAVSFNPNQNAKQMKAAADNVIWALFPAYPQCSPVLAQAKDYGAGSDEFTYYSTPAGAPAQCAGSGAACTAISGCCPGLECSQGACAAPAAAAPGNPQEPAYTPTTSGQQTRGSSGSAGLILGGVIVAVVVGGAAYYFLSMRKNKDEEAERLQHHKKR